MDGETTVILTDSKLTPLSTTLRGQTRWNILDHLTVDAPNITHALIWLDLDSLESQKSETTMVFFVDWSALSLASCLMG